MFRIPHRILFIGIFSLWVWLKHLFEFSCPIICLCNSHTNQELNFDDNIVLFNIISFPEVAGNAGIYFEVNNQEDLKSKIEKVLKDNDYRESYIQKGFEQVRNFDWEIAASQCLELYKKAING